VLHAVSYLQPPKADDGGVSAAAVAQYTGIGERRCATICGQIAALRTGAWIYPVAIDPKRYRTTMAGDEALSDAIDSPGFLDDEGKWADRMRWPWREEDSARKNVAIPTGGTVPDRGWSTWARTQHFLEHGEDYDESEASRYLRSLLG